MNASCFSKLLHGAAFAIALAAAGYTTSAEAAIMRHDVPSSEYEAFFADPIFQSVGWLVGTNENGSFVSGAGVLIAPDWVLTAAHVIDHSSLGLFTSMKFSLSNSIYTEPPNYVSSDALYVFPGWVNDSTVGNNVDLGLIHLSTPITDVIPAERFRGEDQRGTLIYAAGYGIPGTGDGDYSGVFDGIGRAGSVIAEKFGGDVQAGTFEPQYWNATMWEPGDSRTQPLEWLLSAGDSGGGWFADVAGDGTYQLVGINSFIKGGYHYGSDSGAIRVSLYNDWIDTTMQPVPEPSSILLLTSGMMAAVARRRRAVRSKSA